VANSIKGLDGSAIGASNNSSPVEQVRASTTLGTSSNSARPSADTDSVQITDTARQMASLAAAVQDAPEVDTARVQALQQSIASGKYTINPERIADGLMQFEQVLATRK
jgi:negative regulator of flagellin synthesis FlgM